MSANSCAMCEREGTFQVEDLPVGPRWFCTEKHFAQYAGLPVKEFGYYGFEAEYDQSIDISMTCPKCEKTLLPVGEGGDRKSENMMHFDYYCDCDEKPKPKPKKTNKPSKYVRFVDDKHGVKVSYGNIAKLLTESDVKPAFIKAVNHMDREDLRPFGYDSAKPSSSAFFTSAVLGYFNIEGYLPFNQTQMLCSKCGKLTHNGLRSQDGVFCNSCLPYFDSLTKRTYNTRSYPSGYNAESFEMEGMLGNWEGKKENEPVSCPNCKWDGLESDLHYANQSYYCPECKRKDWEYIEFNAESFEGELPLVEQTLSMFGLTVAEVVEQNIAYKSEKPYGTAQIVIDKYTGELYQNPDRKSMNHFSNSFGAYASQLKNFNKWVGLIKSHSRGGSSGPDGRCVFIVSLLINRETGEVLRSYQEVESKNAESKKLVQCKGHLPSCKKMIDPNRTWWIDEKGREWPALDEYGEEGYCDDCIGYSIDSHSRALGQGHDAEGELEREYFTWFGDKRGGKEWGEYTFTWLNNVGDWKPIEEDTDGWDDWDYADFREQKEYEFVNDMLNDNDSRLYRWVAKNMFGDEETFFTNYKVLNEDGEEDELDLIISWGEPKDVQQKIQYYEKEPLHKLEFLGEGTLEPCPHELGIRREEVNWEGDGTVHVTVECDDCWTSGEGHAVIEFEDGERWKDEMAAESKKLPPVEKAIDTGIASGATMEGLETLLAAEDENATLCPHCEDAEATEICEWCNGKECKECFQEHMVECNHCDGEGEIPRSWVSDSGDRWSPPSLDVTAWEMCDYCNEGQVCGDEDIAEFSWDAESFSADEQKACHRCGNTEKDGKLWWVGSRKGFVCGDCSNGGKKYRAESFSAKDCDHDKYNVISASEIVGGRRMSVVCVMCDTRGVGEYQYVSSPLDERPHDLTLKEVLDVKWLAAESFSAEYSMYEVVMFDDLNKYRDTLSMHDTLEEAKAAAQKHSETIHSPIYVIEYPIDDDDYETVAKMMKNQGMVVHYIDKYEAESFSADFRHHDLPEYEDEDEDGNPVVRKIKRQHSGVGFKNLKRENPEIHRLKIGGWTSNKYVKVKETHDPMLVCLKCGEMKEANYPWGCFDKHGKNGFAHYGFGRIKGFTEDGHIVWKGGCGYGGINADTRSQSDIAWFKDLHECKEAESKPPDTDYKCDKCKEWMNSDFVRVCSKCSIWVCDTCSSGGGPDKDFTCGEGEGEDVDTCSDCRPPIMSHKDYMEKMGKRGLGAESFSAATIVCDYCGQEKSDCVRIQEKEYPDLQCCKSCYEVYGAESFAAESFIVYGEYKNGQRIKLGQSATARGAKRIMNNKVKAGVLNFEKYETYGFENANNYFFNQDAYTAESYSTKSGRIEGIEGLLLKYPMQFAVLMRGVPGNYSATCGGCDGYLGEYEKLWFDDENRTGGCPHCMTVFATNFLIAGYEDEEVLEERLRNRFPRHFLDAESFSAESDELEERCKTCEEMMVDCDCWNPTTAEQGSQIVGFCENKEGFCFTNERTYVCDKCNHCYVGCEDRDGNIPDAGCKCLYAFGRLIASAESDELEESKKRTKMSAIRTGLAITTFGIVMWNLWTNKKQEKDIADIMDLV
jgi:hypothetical protein